MMKHPSVARQISTAGDPSECSLCVSLSLSLPPSLAVSDKTTSTWGPRSEVVGGLGVLCASLSSNLKS